MDPNVPYLSHRNLLHPFRQGIWHADRNPEYPVDLVIECDRPEQISGLGLLAQPGRTERLRSPERFLLQGASDPNAWTTLLEVRDSGLDRSQRWLEWPVETDRPYRLYRLRILSNCGDPHLLTLHKMRLRLAEKDPEHADERPAR